MVDKKVCIIGLGLIGGSIARVLREKLGIKDIIALNRTESSYIKAVEDGTIRAGFTEINDEVLSSDIIFICTPVKRTTEFIELLSGKVKPGCIITDVSSTKHEITEYVNNMSNPPVFIGGHPMAGSEKTGYSESYAHLFENAFYILTPSKTSDDESIELLRKMAEGMGAIPVILDAGEHDYLTAGISHVPHVIASAIVNLVRISDTPDGKMHMLSSGGFKDITRIASSSPEVWESIITSNGHSIKLLLERFSKLIEEFGQKIASGDKKWIYDFFESAKTYRNTFSSGKKSLISPSYELEVDVADTPGVIGKIATLLGEHMINIKNINVSNSREYENGCLRITLADQEGMNNSHNLLSEAGFKVNFSIN